VPNTGFIWLRKGFSENGSKNLGFIQTEKFLDYQGKY
jgi:hypothetical protein